MPAPGRRRRRPARRVRRATPSKAALDGPAHLVHQLVAPGLAPLGVGRGSIFGWIVTLTRRARRREHALGRQHVARPAQRHRQDGEPRLERQVERALLEGQELAGPAARALRARSRRGCRWPAGPGPRRGSGWPRSRSLRSMEMNPAAASAPPKTGTRKSSFFVIIRMFGPIDLKEYGDVVERLVVAHHEVRLVRAAGSRGPRRRP